VLVFHPKSHLLDLAFLNNAWRSKERIQKWFFSKWFDFISTHLWNCGLQFVVENLWYRKELKWPDVLIPQTDLAKSSNTRSWLMSKDSNTSFFILRRSSMSCSDVEPSGFRLCFSWNLNNTEIKKNMRYMLFRKLFHLRLSWCNTRICNVC
jgi:hypothetical protein